MQTRSVTPASRSSFYGFFNRVGSGLTSAAAKTASKTCSCVKFVAEPIVKAFLIDCLIESIALGGEKAQFNAVQAGIFWTHSQDKPHSEQQTTPLSLIVGSTMACITVVTIIGIRGRRFYQKHFSPEFTNPTEQDEHTYPETILGKMLAGTLNFICLIKIPMLDLVSCFISSYGTYESFVNPHASDEDPFKNAVALKLFISSIIVIFPLNYTHSAFINSNAFAYRLEQGTLTKVDGKVAAFVVLANIPVLLANAGSTYYSAENGARRIIYLKDWLNTETAIQNFAIASVIENSVSSLIMFMPGSFDYFNQLINSKVELDYRSNFDRIFHKLMVPFILGAEVGTAIFFQASFSTLLPKLVKRWVDCDAYSLGNLITSASIAAFSGAYGIAYQLNHLYRMTHKKKPTSLSERLLATAAETPAVGHGQSSPRFLTHTITVQPEHDSPSNSSVSINESEQNVPSPRASSNPRQS